MSDTVTVAGIVAGTVAWGGSLHGVAAGRVGGRKCTGSRQRG
jgi:hypothetical protein